VNDPLISRFADACGATAPLDLRVDLAGGGLLAEGSIAQPFTLIGRDDACDVTLTDPEINPRHSWLQVVGGRVFAVDLGSRSGLVWPGHVRGPGWLDAGGPVRLGPFMLQLRTPVSPKPQYPADYNPMISDPAAKNAPSVALEFKNGRRAKDRWNVNRMLTLIGRAAECKIHLTADDISPYHCGLVFTPAGLWVVDLSGRGVVVNGERMRVAPLPHGAELWVGRFLIGCQYTAPVVPPPRPVPPPVVEKGGKFPPVTPPARPVPAPLSDARVTATPAPVAFPFGSPPPVPGVPPLFGSPSPVPGVPPLVPGPPPAPAPFIDDEVALGAEPEPDELTGSHIMSDAFRQWAPGGSPGTGGGDASGPMSNPIHVSGSGPTPPAGAVPPGSALAGLLDDSSAGGSDWSVVPLLRQMADLHGRTVAEFQQTLTLTGHAFGRVRRDHLAVLHHELSRIQELTAEIVRLECEVTRQTIESAALQRARQLDAAEPGKPGEPRPDSRVSPSTRTPLPDLRTVADLAARTTPEVPNPPGVRTIPNMAAPTASDLPSPEPPVPRTVPDLLARTTPDLPTRIAERLTALHQERAARWQALIAMFAGT
jgi:hypothetical protein